MTSGKRDENKDMRLLEEAGRLRRTAIHVNSQKAVDNQQ